MRKVPSDKDRQNEKRKSQRLKAIIEEVPKVEPEIVKKRRKKVTDLEG